MAIAFPPAKKGSHTPPSRYLDDDGFDTGFDHDVVRLLQENARLRALVTQLTSLVLKHVADQK
ncbi:MAG: hypothetical protein ACREDY_09160 [Bradyrhizobium sp.]